MKEKFRLIGATETGPDIELIEPQIETIDLEKESDSEESRDSTAMREPQQNVDLGIVKTEKIDEISDDDDVSVLETMHIPLQSNDNDENENNLEDSIANIVQEEINDIDIDEEHFPAADEDHEEDSINSKQFPSATERNDNILANVQSNDFSDHQEVVEDQDDTGVLMPMIVASTSITNISVDVDDLMPKITNVTSNADLREDADDTVSNEVDGILESLAENMSAKKLYNVPLTAETNVPNQLQVSETDALVKNIIDEEINSKFKETVADKEKMLDSLDAVPNDMFDGIELEDDGIEYVEEDDAVTCKFCFVSTNVQLMLISSYYYCITAKMCTFYSLINWFHSTTSPHGFIQLVQGISRRISQIQLNIANFIQFGLVVALMSIKNI